MNRKVKGYVLGAVAAATYGMNPLFALPLYADGMGTDSVLFFRYSLSLPFLAMMLVMRGRDFKINLKEAGELSVMGILLAVSSLALFLSYSYMDAGIASTMLFVYPIMVAVLMTVVYKEKLTLQTAVCIILALSGIALLYQNSDGTTLSITGVLLVFLSSLSYAIYIVGVNRPRLARMATLKVTFYVLMFGLTVYIVRLAMAGTLDLPTKWYLWFNVLALAIFPTCISFLCTTSAIQCIGATPTAILGALEPVTAIFFGVTVFGEVLTMREAFGVVLIILAVSFVVAGGRLTTLFVRFRKLFPRLNKWHRQR